jgi:hypothetical protein
MSGETIVDDITARLAILLPLIDASAPIASQDPPNSIAPSAGRTWITVPGPEHKDFDWGGRVAAFTGPDGGVYVSVRTYKITLVVGTMGAGGPGDLPAAVRPLLNKFGPFFMGRPHLADPANAIAPLVGVLKTVPGDDTGTVVVAVNNMECVGVTFDLEISALVEYTFVAGE